MKWPLDEKAERDHCERAWVVILNDDDCPPDEWLMRERAAAVEQYRAMRVYDNGMLVEENERLRSELKELRWRMEGLEK